MLQRDLDNMERELDKVKQATTAAAKQGRSPFPPCSMLVYGTIDSTLCQSPHPPQVLSIHRRRTTPPRGSRTTKATSKPRTCSSGSRPSGARSGSSGPRTRSSNRTIWCRISTRCRLTSYRRLRLSRPRNPKMGSLLHVNETMDGRRRRRRRGFAPACPGCPRRTAARVRSRSSRSPSGPNDSCAKRASSPARLVSSICVHFPRRPPQAQQRQQQQQPTRVPRLCYAAVGDGIRGTSFGRRRNGRGGSSGKWRCCGRKPAAQSPFALLTLPFTFGGRASLHETIRLYSLRLFARMLSTRRGSSHVCTLFDFSLSTSPRRFSSYVHSFCFLFFFSGRGRRDMSARERQRSMHIWC